MNLVLASESSFRRRALDILGLKYIVVPSGIDERAYPRGDPSELVTELARRKALAVAANVTDAIIVAGDAVVASGTWIFEKPQDEVEAEAMLSQLSGRTFDFITGLAVYNSQTSNLMSIARSCSITFRALEESEIREYIANNLVLKCAGAFDDNGVLRFSEEVRGYLNFTCGLHVGDLIRFLRAQGVSV